MSKHKFDTVGVVLVPIFVIIYLWLMFRIY